MDDEEKVKLYFCQVYMMYNQKKDQEKNMFYFPIIQN